MKYRAIKISPHDNVAVLVQPTHKGKTVSVAGSGEAIVVNQEIPFGHKIALVPIAKGEAVLRYNEVICIAAKDIKPGEWVHVHNTASEVTG